jgi:uncharacterized membrane protein YhiD involved in acid resistance
MVRSLAFDIFRMAQDVVSGQGFLEIRREGGTGEIIPPEVKTAILTTATRRWPQLSSRRVGGWW